MADSTSDHRDAAHDDHENHSGIGQYLLVFGALCVLTFASFFTYSDLWPFKATPAVGWAFMMAVSCTKATLVVLFFMHLLWEANWKYVLTLPCIFMSIFLTLMLVPDVGLRLRHASRERLQYTAAPQAAEHDGTPHQEQPGGEKPHKPH